MASLILAVNASSSSLKISVFRLASPLGPADRHVMDSTTDGRVVLIASCSVTSTFSSKVFIQ